MLNSHGQVVISQKERTVILCNFNRVIKGLVCLDGDARVLVED